MSDYFGALMNFSGLAAAPRASVPTPAGAPHATDIMESDVVREVAVDRPTAAPRRAAPLTAPLANLASAAEQASPTARLLPSPAPTPAAAETARSLAPDAISVPASPIAPAPVAATAPANMPAEHGRALVRAALSWVAADPESADEAPALNSPTPPRQAPREPSVRPEPARAVPDDIDVAPAQARARTEPAPPARVIRFEPPEPARATARPATAEAPDEIVEISIGAIHVRVDAPAPTTAARTLPAAAPSSPRSNSEPVHERSALARRALRRI